MCYKHNIIKERFDLRITTENGTTKGEFELDHNANYLLGIGITSDQEEQMFYRGSQKIQINDKELFPENFETKLLMCGLNVPPDQRMITVGEIETGNGKLEIWYKDSPSAHQEFEPYRVTIYTFSLVNKP